MICIASNDSQIRAEIRNDGSLRTESSIVDRGTGLSGVAERLAKVGGTIEAGALLVSDGSGFQVKVDIPVRR